MLTVAPRRLTRFGIAAVPRNWLNHLWAFLNISRPDFALCRRRAWRTERPLCVGHHGPRCRSCPSWGRVIPSPTGQSENGAKVSRLIAPAY